MNRFKKELWMVGSYTTGATHYCITEEDALATANNPDCYSPDDPYVFIEELLHTKSPYKYINTVTGEVTRNIWTAIRTTLQDYKNYKVITRWTHYHG